MILLKTQTGRGVAETKKVKVFEASFTHPEQSLFNSVGYSISHNTGKVITDVDVTADFGASDLRTHIDNHMGNVTSTTRYGWFSWSSSDNNSQQVQIYTVGQGDPSYPITVRLYTDEVV